MILRGGYLAVAAKLQEAAVAMSDGDKWTRLSDTLHDIFRGTGTWAYLVAIFGDDKAGYLIYSADESLRKANYTIADAKCTIDTTAAKDVYPLTTYHEESLATTEAGRRNSSRDLRQLQSIHDAAKSLGAACAMAEATRVAGVLSGAIELKESAAFPVDIMLAEALTPGKKIKLIAPGKGSSAWYTEAALKRAVADNVFKAGTPMRIDHPTKAEEAARPEGSVRDWGAVLAHDAYWLDDHAEGPGLFSEIKPFSDHAQMIEEKAPYSAVSIRANGFAVIEGGKPVMRDGVPVLEKFTSAEGVDMVTRAGAGGMFLSEAARPAANPNEGGAADMDAAELKKLQESVTAQAATNAAIMANNARLLERALRGDARELAQTILKPLTLHEAAKIEVIENCLRAIPKTEAGEIDAPKFTEAVNAEAKRIGALAAVLSGAGGVTGLGAAAPVVPIDATETARREASAKRLRESAVRNFQETWGMGKEAAEAAADRMLAGEVA